MDNSKNANCKQFYDAMLEGYVELSITENTHDQFQDCRIIEVNKQFETITKLSRDEVVGKDIRHVLPALNQNWSEFSRNLPQTDENVRFEFYFENIDRHFLISALRYSKSQVILLFTEITLQKKAKDAFRMHEILFENAQDIMLYLKMDGQIINANKRAYEQYGYTRQQLLSMNIQDLRHSSTAPEYEWQMQQANDDGIVFECIHMRSDGSFFPVEVSAKSTYTENGQFRIHIIRDITKRKENERKIAWLANFDVLTGIPNRANFVMHLENEIKNSTRNETVFAVMLFDIDKFKYINDHYGHEAGDKVLCHVAKAAQGELGPSDRIARLGGDEFVVLQTGIKTEEDIITLVKKIQLAVNEEIIYKEKHLRVEISVGISLFPEDAVEANVLLHCADKAMYKVKQNGGGAYSFTSTCNPQCTDKICSDKDADIDKVGISR